MDPEQNGAVRSAENESAFKQTSSASDVFVLVANTVNRPQVPENTKPRSEEHRPPQKKSGPPHYELVMCITADGSVCHGIAHNA